MPKTSQVKNKIEFEKDKVYLMEHNHKAFGGGYWEAKVDNIIGDKVSLNGKWHVTKTYLETRTIISEIK